MCVPSVYRTLGYGSERVLILEFAAVNAATGSSFLEWSLEMLTSKWGGLITEAWVGLGMRG